MTDQTNNFVAPQTVELVGDESRHTKAQLIEALIMQTVLVANVDEEVQRMQNEIDELDLQNSRLRERLAAVSADRGQLLLENQNMHAIIDSMKGASDLVDDDHQAEVEKLQWEKKKLRRRTKNNSNVIAELYGLHHGWALSDDAGFNNAAAELWKILEKADDGPKV